MASISFPDSTQGALTLPAIFSDNMVLQQQIPLKIWGLADPGETVSVSFAADQTTTKADEAGRWNVLLPAQKANAAPTELVIRGKSEIHLKNVLVGEVWLCSGQSNMAMGLLASEGADAEIAAAAHPLFRFFISPQNPEAVARWKVSNPQTVLEDGETHHGWPRWKGISAVGYYFGKELQNKLGVPVGVIQAAVGGSNIQSWLAPAGNLYKSMVQPLAPFPIRGVIWYQGESNNTEAKHYFQASETWLKGWRAAWDEPEMPFFITQIAPHKGDGDTDPFIYPEFWETQASIARDLPGVGIVSTMDVGDIEDIHPVKKKEVGQRLALQALRKTYGHSEIVSDGPHFKSLTIEGSNMRLIFDDVGSGLKSRDGKALNCFEIIDGVQGGFVPAQAKIDGNCVVVSSPAVHQPVAVRFGWNKTAQPNLMNAEGLPAYPFRAGENNIWRVFRALSTSTTFP